MRGRVGTVREDRITAVSLLYSTMSNSNYGPSTSLAALLLEPITPVVLHTDNLPVIMHSTTQMLGYI